MRRYKQKTDAELTQVVCNKCGKCLNVERGILKEGCFHGSSSFGYFSRRDGETHSFDLCEECYEEITAQFAVPVEVLPNVELI